ncbi:MAG: hypothetical protein JNK56_35525 [Myxococcales bacterium]|nr:hypothetical protein [Myxococcales bacterium]
MHTNFIRILAATVLLTALPACDGGAPPKADAKKVAAKADPKADAKAPDSKPVVTPEPKPVEKPAVVDPADSKIQLAASVAKEISGAPDKADEILGKHGLDRDKLDALMFEIAGDPALTQRYMDARSAG